MQAWPILTALTLLASAPLAAQPAPYPETGGAFREPHFAQSYPPAQPQSYPQWYGETAQEWYYRNYIRPRSAYQPVPPSAMSAVSDKGSPSGGGIFNNEYGANDKSSLY